jgi:sugar/nucleoside kinase (ribokinase family)
MAYTYTPFPGTTIREAIENAIRMARATGKDVIININDVQFCVNRDTKIQAAIDTYMAALNKRYHAKQSQEHTR